MKKLLFYFFVLFICGCSCGCAHVHREHIVVKEDTSYIRHITDWWWNIR